MVVVDAGIVIALVVPDLHQELVVANFKKWLEDGEPLHAPAVMPYEVLNVVARQVFDGQLTQAEAAGIWTKIDRLGISLHAFDLLSDGPRASAIAEILNRRHATDCAYIALAERLDAEVWTIDQAFTRAATSKGFRVQAVS